MTIFSAPKSPLGLT